MPNYRRAREGQSYFFTVVTHDRRPVLCEAPVRRLLREVVQELKARRPFAIDAWVLVPDHLHCIWTLPEGDTDYSARWGWLKKEVTKRLRDLAAPVPAGTARPTGECGPHHGLESLAAAASPSLWQRRFWEHQIRDERDFANHCDYIHYNPVKHGLVRCAGDWPWSTFRRFVRNGLYSENWGEGEIRIPDYIGNE
mgnify:CR=1 FL=1